MLYGRGVTKAFLSRILLESGTVEGESPVGERKSSPGTLPSSAGLVESGVNSGGPPSKAKYLLATDSEPVGRLNNEKNPC
jgi:hypothetical protein